MKDKRHDPAKAQPKLMEPDVALDTVLEHTSRKSPAEYPLAQAAGRTLAQAIVADRDYPPFDRAMMDGVAVRIEDQGKTVEIIGEVAAGQAPDVELRPGTCVEIMTGASCPGGTEAVVQKEKITRTETGVTLPSPIKEGKNIAHRGSDCAAQTEMLKPGDTLTPLAVGMAASFGYEKVDVYPEPTLGVIATGRELIEAGARPGPFQIRNSNGPVLLAMASRLAGLTETVHVMAVDTEASLASALDRVKSCDIIALTGGVSAGKYDIVPGSVESFGAKIIFHKVRQKPGKPLLFAKRNEQLIFGLPGNPLAVHLCFHRYVAAAIRKMMGKPPYPVRFTGKLTAPLVPKGLRDRFELVLATLDHDSWNLTPAKTASSADLFNTSRANAYVRVTPGPDEIPAGRTVEFFIIGEWGWTT